MELRDIRAFLCVAQLGSFSKAAEELGYTQPAVTMQVKHLEAELGTRLFDRLPHGIALTNSGDSLAFYANELMRMARTAEDVVREGRTADGDMKEPIRLGSVESLASAYLPALLARYRARYPGVRVEIVTGRRELIEEGLRKNDLDLLLTMEHRLAAPWLAGEVLREEPIVLVAAPGLVEGFRSATGDLPSFSAADLVRLPFVLTERERSYRFELDRMLAEVGLSIEPVVEAGNTDTLVRLAEFGVGATFVPHFSAAPALDAGSLVALPCDLPPMTMATQILHHKSKWLMPHMQAFIELAREFFA